MLGHYQLMTPKQKYTVRPATLLDPIDTILFTGLVFRVAPLIEQKRSLITDDRVFSFRFKQIDAGRRFTLESDWDGFVHAIKARDPRYKMVAKADIVDFFPRIYLHRLKNAIASICGREQEKEAIMKFLETWSRGTSYGIPVGPLASNLLAEALLVEVDEYLLSINADFVRHIDDYIIFGNTEADCIRFLFQLGARLHQTQGLSLNMAKTKPMMLHDLVLDLIKPEDSDRGLRQKIIETVFSGDPYAIVDYEKLSAEQKKMIDKLNVKETIEGALRLDIADLGGIKFVLNVLSALRRPDLVEIVLENLDRLFPVSDAVARFLNVFDKVEEADRLQIGKKILEYLQGAQYVPDFQFLWLLEPFAVSEKWNHLKSLRNIAREHRNRMIRRQAILSLGMIGDRSALLDVKSALQDTSDWEWRAIVFACRKLPEDERDAFYRSIRIGRQWNINTILPKAVLEYGKIATK